MKKEINLTQFSSIDKNRLFQKLSFIGYLLLGIGLAKLFDYFFPEYLSYRIPHYALWALSALVGWLYADI